MTLDEVIKRVEEVAKEQEEDANKWEYTLSVYRRRDYCEPSTIPTCEKKLKMCKERATEHRQLANWLNELKRARILLKATHNLFEKQMESGYVLNLLSETVFYDEAECDGQCLMEDIENLLKYHV